jgi:hypothetical protein
MDYWSYVQDAETHVVFSYDHSILTKTHILRKISVKYGNIKFNDN